MNIFLEFILFESLRIDSTNRFIPVGFIFATFRATATGQLHAWYYKSTRRILLSYMWCFQHDLLF